MLSHLFIANYALIEELNIDLPEGFLSITGETGAGKSILLGAIGLLSGNRADTSVLNINTSKCIIEGTFEIKQYELKALFESMELDYDDQTIIRREITPSGKSRAFINDTPVPLKDLKQIGERLMDIHGQFSSLELANSVSHLRLLDNYAQVTIEISDYRKAFENWKSAQQNLNKLLLEAENAKKEEDYLRFSVQQLREVDLDNLNQQFLEEKRTVLEHSETIKSTLFSLAGELSENDNNLLERIAGLQKEMEAISKYSSKYEQIAQRLESISIETEDISREIISLNEDLRLDPDELMDVQEKIDKIYSLQHKFSCNSIEELIAIRDEIGIKLSRTENFDFLIKEAEKKISATYEILKSKAKALSAKRESAIKPFTDSVSGLLTFVNLEDAVFRIHKELLPEPGISGMEKITFLFSANKGIDASDLGKTASGGELSRLMLAVKAVISDKNALPTIIFDEIEAGVSGSTAGKIATVLSNMGKSMQVITITHLPQIAAKSACQYKVSKTTTDEKTVSQMYKLSQEERIEELAEMLSDGAVSPHARENARVLLNSR
jgi:DNA repair protein RecN (Recombination protein N)